jgi:SagB-type dehydrogenase family enzyme
MSERFEEISYSLVDFFEDDDHSEAETFHEYTKLNRTNAMLIARRVETIMADPALVAMMARSWKTYPGSMQVELPPFTPPPVSFADVVLRRRSVSSLGRDFIGGAIDLEQLSGTLRLAYSPTTVLTGPSGAQQGLRSTASAGALYPTEVYVAAFDVNGLEQGLYHYRPMEHTLELVRGGDLRDEFAAVSSYTDLCRSASVAIIMTTVMKRTLSKYLHRGYRFAMYDCGALIQSFYLAGTAMSLDTCAVGGVYDDELTRFVGTSPVDEPAQIAFLLGPDGGRPDPREGAR